MFTIFNYSPDSWQNNISAGQMEKKKKVNTSHSSCHQPLLQKPGGGSRVVSYSDGHLVTLSKQK